MEMIEKREKMERLTKKENFNNEYLDSAVYWHEAKQMALKLHELENIMEKYGIESAEELESWLDNDRQERIATHRNQFEIEVLRRDRDTWKRACELAIDYCNDYMYECEGIGGINKDAIDFYAEAQKEMKK